MIIVASAKQSPHICTCTCVCAWCACVCVSVNCFALTITSDHRPITALPLLILAQFSHEIWPDLRKRQYECARKYAHSSRDRARSPIILFLLIAFVNYNYRTWMPKTCCYWFHMSSFSFRSSTSSLSSSLLLMLLLLLLLVRRSVGRLAHITANVATTIIQTMLLTHIVYVCAVHFARPFYKGSIWMLCFFLYSLLPILFSSF